MNNQAPEKKIPETTKEVNEIEIVNHWYTIQGEGPFVGMPAWFIRLAGCNLQCPLCDTDYTTNRTKWISYELVEDIVKLAHEPPNLIVLTGGEPFRQNLSYLIHDIFEQIPGCLVQIETNGTIWRDDFGYYGHDQLTIVCSPKTPKISEKLEPFIDAYKYILDADHIHSDGLPSQSLGMNGIPARPPIWYRKEIYVQPMDPPNAIWPTPKDHQLAAVKSCLAHGYRMCLQTHKLLGLE